MSPIASKPSLQAPLTGQALRHSVAEHQVETWTAWARALRVAGYRVDPARLADQLLRNGCATVQDAFGHDVSVQVKVPVRAVAPVADDAALEGAGAGSSASAAFRIAS